MVGLLSPITILRKMLYYVTITILKKNGIQMFTDGSNAITELGITVGMSLLKLKNKIVRCHHPFRKYSHKVASDQKTLKSVHN